MLKIAVYGKGGIGKSTTVSNVAAALADKGLRVMQIGCDPKADSTILLRGDQGEMKTILDLVRENEDQNSITLDDMVRIGYKDIVCAEAGGPTPGLGCAGRGIIAALTKLAEKGAYDKYKPDVVLYDVLGDVVCGGFSMPMRPGYADYVMVVTSGENMSIYAAANISMAVEQFKNRGYAKFAGLILNRRKVKDEDEKVAEFAKEINSKVVGSINRSDLIQSAEELNKTVVEAFPDSSLSDEYRKLADQIMASCEALVC
ncbi:nucleotide-binding protein [Loigolactobacillus binensis]|uniref:nitrogenase n=1 Tax=Loigolactobacillus binensis TaxID=2559922 RepID=A0ABW3E7W4_9LACO|nr:nitrogenase iron protein NifH [Loigolactobacillus binensis]